MPTTSALPYMLLSVAALAVGPAVAGPMQRRAHMRAAIDGFVLIMVGGLCMTAILPHAYEAIGPWALPLAALGFGLPHFSERRLHRHEEHEHEEPRLLLALAVAGLGLHAAVDGASLALGSEHTTRAIAIAILFHRIPVGLFIWWSMRPRFGLLGTSAILGLLALSTVVGYSVGSGLHELASGIGGGALHALLAGGLLHIIASHGPIPGGRTRHRGWAAWGALLALLPFALLPDQFDPVVARGMGKFWQLLVESGFAIVAGFLGAGLLSMLPAHALARWMRGRSGLESAFRGMLFGIPLPVCSCGVVPLYRSLARKGVPAAAAAAFLVATPELGMDALLISVPFLGWKIAVVRLVAAIVVALAVGVVAHRLVPPTDVGREAMQSAMELEDRRSFAGAMRYAFVESVDELGPWILAGLLLAGFLEPVLSPEWFDAVPTWSHVPLFALLATPLYICASGATPIAAILLSKGVGVGAVIAFLISGPATNLTTFGAIRSVHTRRDAWILVIAIPLASITVGWVVQALMGDLGPVAGAALHEHEDQSWWKILFASAFAFLLIASFLRQGPRRFLEQLGVAEEDEHHHHDGSHCDDC